MNNRYLSSNISHLIKPAGPNGAKQELENVNNQYHSGPALSALHLCFSPPPPLDSEKTTNAAISDHPKLVVPFSLGAPDPGNHRPGDHHPGMTPTKTFPPPLRLSSNVYTRVRLFSRSLFFFLSSPRSSIFSRASLTERAITVFLFLSLSDLRLSPRLSHRRLCQSRGVRGYVCLSDAGFITRDRRATGARHLRASYLSRVRARRA